MLVLHQMNIPLLFAAPLWILHRITIKILNHFLPENHLFKNWYPTLEEYEATLTSTGRVMAGLFWPCIYLAFWGIVFIFRRFS
jgi:hypothetical protein